MMESIVKEDLKTCKILVRRCKVLERIYYQHSRIPVYNSLTN